MATSGETDSVMGGLKKLFPQVSSLLLAQDAQNHQQFIQTLMSAIQGYLSSQAQSTIQSAGRAAQPGGGGPQALSGPAGSPQSAGPSPAGLNSGAPTPGGANVAGMVSSAISENPDELRRLLTATTNP